jgi:hypothetical protein
MPDRPYTDDDLRAEAARQLYAHRPSGQWPIAYAAMLDAHIESRRDSDAATWTEALAPAELDAPARAISDLINGAVDTSAWAVDLGADSLVPSTEHEITLNAGRPIARIHFAFEPDMPDDMRTDLVEGIGDAINAAGAEREDEPDDDGEPADSDAEVFDLISDIASKLRDATDSGEYHAVGLIYDLAMSRTTVAEARVELADIEFGHV